MIERAIYYRRKEGKIICEGKRKGKTIYLFTIPEPLELLNSSLFPQDKREKIKEKISRLDYKKDKVKKNASKVVTTKIIRTQEDDDWEAFLRETANDLR